ncbi:peptidase inhibitor family I36 protein [Streptomyces sp. NBC_00414]|uniref:peptidase inhibitor family I36 protein n=1 Tax=Streptomyces sp. NBC_00414 TaxID=2975739 RepID=UPI002E1E89AF
MRKRNVAGAAVSVGIALSLVTTVTSSASAANEKCPVGYLCVYDSDSFTGQVYAFPAANGYYKPDLNYDPPKWLSGVYLNDHISSIINNTRYSATFFKDAN